MDILTGLTLDANSVPSVNAIPPLDENGVSFDAVLEDEIALVHELEASLFPTTTEFDLTAENTVRKPISELDSDDGNQRDSDADTLSILLTGQQQVVLTSDSAPAAVQQEFLLRDTGEAPGAITVPLNQVATNDASAEVKIGQPDEKTGKALPFASRASLPVNTKLTTAARARDSNEVGVVDHSSSLPVATLNDTANTDTGADDFLATILPSEATQDKKAEKNSIVAQKTDIAVNSVLQANSGAATVLPKMAAAGPSSVMPTSSTINSLQPSSALKNDVLVAARGGDINKWLSKDDVSSTAPSATDSSAVHASGASEFKTVEASIPSGLRLPFFNPRFNDVVSNQVLWMSKQGINQADIHLNPAELGPITVKLQQSGQETSVQFVVAHPATKEQLEQALPRLRDVFHQGGLQLINVDIQDGRKQSPQDGQTQNTPTRPTPAPSPIASSLAAPLTSAPEGLVDFYA